MSTGREEPDPRQGRPLEPSEDELGQQPTSELMLAHALEACLRAERRRPGSSGEVIAHAPASAQPELRRMLDLARRLSAASEAATPSAAFRAAARARLLERLGAESLGGRGARITAISTPPVAGRRVRRRWLVRGGLGLLAATLAVAATLSASASALPGDPLYAVKKTQEDLDLRLAADDQARVLSMLQHADTRLDETSRLLDAGRTQDASNTAQQYDQTIERATTTYVLTLEGGDAAHSSTAPMQIKLDADQQHLQTIIRQAPDGVRPDLREALVTTERGRELVADPAPIQQALGARPSRTAVAAAAPAVEPTHAPPPTPTSQPTPVPSPTQATVVQVEPTRAPVEDEDAVVASEAPQAASDADSRSNGHGGDTQGGNSTGSASVTRSNPSSVTRRGAPQVAEPGESDGGRGNAATALPPTEAHTDVGAPTDTDARAVNRADGEGSPAQFAPPVVADSEPPAQSDARGDAGNGGDDGNRGEGGAAVANSTAHGNNGVSATNTNTGGGENGSGDTTSAEARNADASAGGGTRSANGGERIVAQPTAPPQQPPQVALQQGTARDQGDHPAADTAGASRGTAAAATATGSGDGGGSRATPTPTPASARTTASGSSGSSASGSSGSTGSTGSSGSGSSASSGSGSTGGKSDDGSHTQSGSGQSGKTTTSTSGNNAGTSTNTNQHGGH